MRVRQLKELINALPDSYMDQPVYVSVINDIQSESRKDNFWPELLNDVTEFVVDTDDNVIALKAIVD